MSDFGNKDVFAHNLSEIMENRGVTAQEICDALGFTPSAFSRWKNGDIYPRIDKIEMLANYFGIQKSDLIESKKDKISPNQIELIEIYRSSPESVQSRILAYAKALYDVSRLEDVKKEDL